MTRNTFRRISWSVVLGWFLVCLAVVLFRKTHEPSWTVLVRTKPNKVFRNVTGLKSPEMKDVKVYNSEMTEYQIEKYYSSGWWSFYTAEGVFILVSGNVEFYPEEDGRCTTELQLDTVETSLTMMTTNWMETTRTQELVSPKP